MIPIAMLVLGLLGVLSAVQLVTWWLRARRSPHVDEPGVSTVRCGYALKRRGIPVGGLPYPLGSLRISADRIAVGVPVAGTLTTWERRNSSIEWIPHPSGLGYQLRLKDGDKSARVFVRNTEPVDAALETEPAPNLPERA